MTGTEHSADNRTMQQAENEGMAGIENAYSLPAGTMLDGRYTVRRVIRQGGFGITYEAVHRQSGQTVAVKEYFCREICVRVPFSGKPGLKSAQAAGKPPAEEGRVTVADPAEQPRFAADLARFMREARILREFAGEPSVVRVLDYFEENGTAYIVMEYLGKRTLRREILEAGRWGMEEAMRRFAPVMEVLARIHRAGVLHRDITPDNLMMMPDGSLRLIDFGAARDIPAYTDTPNPRGPGADGAFPEGTGKAGFAHSAIYTAGYAAPEQRDPGGQLGSWTDVYGLCGVLWFCLTGRDPEDSLSRLLYDELELPSDLGARILPRAEQVLMQGMMLDHEKRIPDMEMLLGELEKTYPRVSEAEKEAREDSRRKKARMAAAVAALVLLCAGLICAVFRTQIRFQFIDTQVTALDGSHMSPEEYAANASLVKGRVEAFAGRGNYLWKEMPGQQILFEVPTKAYGETEPERYVKGMLANRLCMRIYIEENRNTGAAAEGDPQAADGTEEAAGRQKDDDTVKAAESSIYLTGLFEEEDAPYHNEKGDRRDGYYRLGVFTQDKEVAAAVVTENGTRITFTKEAAGRFLGALEVPDRKVLITFDEDGGDYVYKQGITAGDGETVLMQGSEEESSLILFSSPEKLLVKQFSGEPLSSPFGVECVWKVRWEKAGTALLRGANQKDPAEIPEPYIDLRYRRPGSGSSGMSRQGEDRYDVEILSIQTLMKNRLDRLGKPYAVGIMQFAPSEAAVRIPSEGLCREELEDLGRTVYYSLGDGSACADVYMRSSSFQVTEMEDGTCSMDLVMPRTARDSAREALETLKARGGEEVFLHVNKDPFAAADLDDALRSLEERSVISFSRPAFSGEAPMDRESLPMLRYLAECNEQDPKSTYDLEDAQRTDRDGTAFFRAALPPALFPDPGEQWALAWNRESRSDFHVRYDEREKELWVFLYGCRLEDPAPGMEILWEIIQEAESADVPLQKLNGTISEWRPKDGLLDSRPKMNVQLHNDFDTGGWQLSRGYTWEFDAGSREAEEELCRTYNRYVQKTLPWKEMLTGDNKENPFAPGST